MNDAAPKVEIKCDPNGKNKWIVSALQDGKVVYCNTGQPQSDSFRQKFWQALDERIPGEVTREDIDNALMFRTIDYPSTAVDNGAEVDVSSIIRPEQFFHPQVSGFAVPVVRLSEGRPVARWTHLLRWADGKRESRELGASIDVADAGKLFVHPTPAEPTINSAAGWSAPARRRLLEGEQPPDPAHLFKRLVQRIDRYIALPDDSAEGTTATLALWSILTYVFRAWDSVPYLHLGGALSSGKSTAFSVLSRLVFRPITSSSMTGPSLFRTLNDSGGILLFDEAERLKKATRRTSKRFAGCFWPAIARAVAPFALNRRRTGKDSNQSHSTCSDQRHWRAYRPCPRHWRPGAFRSR
jgi:hypothetical protein